MKIIYNRLDLFWRGWVLFGMMEHNRQHEGPGMFLERHPLVGEHHPRSSGHPDHMMIVIDKLLCLCARAHGDGLVGVNLIKATGHAGTNITMRSDG